MKNHIEKILVVLVCLSFVNCKDNFEKKDKIATQNLKNNSAVENENETLLLAKIDDINKDKIKDSLFIYEDNENFLKMKICLSNKKHSFTVLFNNKIVNKNYNSAAEGFRDVVVKNNYFTIEENISTNPIVIQYTTFKVDVISNTIVLNKLGYSTIYPNSENDFDTVYSPINFGKINFENYDSSTILEKCNKK